MATVYLADDLRHERNVALYASYLTGETIFPDGGRLALSYTVPLREDG
jgi:hypothetical protein